MVGQLYGDVVDGNFGTMMEVGIIVKDKK